MWYKYCSLNAVLSLVTSLAVYNVKYLWYFFIWTSTLYGKSKFICFTFNLLTSWLNWDKIFIFAFSDNMKRNNTSSSNTTQSQKSILDFFSSKHVQPTPAKKLRFNIFHLSITLIFKSLSFYNLFNQRDCVCKRNFKWPSKSHTKIAMPDSQWYP